MLSSMADYYVIFGAGVRPDGSPSGTLARRVHGAWLHGRERAESRYLPTGAIGRHGPSEASVMRDLLIRCGVPGERIVLEERGTDTLSSVVECTRILGELGDEVDRVIVCTSPYHIPRCRLLFRIAGVATEAAAMPSDLSALGLRRWLYYVAREVVATPWDAALALLEHTRRHP